MRHFRRPVTQISIVLMLGVMTTVAVAWTAACFDSMTGIQFQGGLHVQASSYTVFGTRRSTFLTETSWYAGPSADVSDQESLSVEILPAWSSATRPDEPQVQMGASTSVWETGSGWPMRAMLSKLRVWPTTLAGAGQSVALSGLVLEPISLTVNSKPVFKPRALPLRILPLGFAIDTALFAAGWWLLLFAFPTTRRLIRARRGTCLKCGYGPLAAPDAVCPECGRVRGERQATRT